MSAIVSGIVGGVVSVIVGAYIAKRVGRSATPGQLRYGSFMWALGLACLAFALLPVGITVLSGHDKEFWAKAALFVGFGFGAVYCFGEAAFVRGAFDDQRLTFSTPWTGTKNEYWKGLLSIEFNGACSWYLLRFKSGKKVRFSTYLSGHVSALEVATQQSGVSSEF
ncbi:MAG: hypothetical protein H4O13_07195 [Xanthomonadales bacterium]|nr:hypothetical protein [Xanthomonadales bacterium]